MKATTAGERFPAVVAAVASALAVAPAGAMDSDLWIEINKPPISLNPFEINPVGYLFFALYGAYLTWSIVRPPSEAEKAYADKMNAKGEEAAALAVEFLEKAAAEEGATTLPSGLVFRETLAGSGENPSESSSVVVHYEGKLANGEVFDSSLARNEPAEFKVGQVITGWREGLQLMKPGGKAVLTIPANLAYGAMSVGSIPANSALQVWGSHALVFK
ncbi:MAG: hypothetical protein SGPRY_008696 [Prymnesium sp.]